MAGNRIAGTGILTHHYRPVGPPALRLKKVGTIERP